MHTASKGFTEDERASIGSLCWEAFGQKLRAGFASESTGMAVVRAADLTWSHLRRQLSLQGALRATLALSLLSRAAHPRSLVLDGICVDSAARGLGIGTALLSSAIGHARQVGAHTVRLTVVDSNPRARALYERRGFAPVDSGSLGPLSFAYGFDGYTTMELAVDR